ncbi:hypothetical protein ABZ752_22670 [Streptomyces roseifaciens]
MMSDPVLDEEVRLYAALLAAVGEPLPRRPLVPPDPDVETLTALVYVSMLDVLRTATARPRTVLQALPGRC